MFGYHYTNLDAFKAMKTGEMYRKKGLIPLMRLVSLKIKGLPEKMYDPVIYGLLEPEPESWTRNTEFSMLWKRHTDDFLQTNQIVLLRFKVLPEDDAYVLERAYIEREQYSSDSTIESITDACLKFYDSRIPALDYCSSYKSYSESYSVPQLTVWSEIPFERLEPMWLKSREEVKKRILEISK